jgi:hypothetical protein
MPFVQQYNNIIESEKKVSKSLVKPRNIYKITSYQYVDGTKKSLSGPETAIIFVFGIYDKKFIGLKITEIKPEDFFKWLKKLFLANLTEEVISESKKLEELLVINDKAGSGIYESYVKNKRIGSTNKELYRTYNITGVKQISEVIIKKDYIKKYIKILKKP